MKKQASKPDVSKLLSMTDNVVIRNRVYKRSRHSEEELREYGRLNKSIDELQETAEHFRKAPQAGDPK